MTTRTVNIALIEATPQQRRLIFTPDLASLGGSLLLELQYETVTADDGTGSIDLPVADSGEIVYNYEIPGYPTNSTGSFAIAAGSAVDFDALVVAGGTASDSVKTYIDAQIAELPGADPDLTAIGAMDSSVAGMIASDGAGWIKKTYTQVKTALGLAKSDIGLSNVDNTSDVNKPVSIAQAAADAAVLASAEGYADTGLAGKVPTTRTVNGHALSSNVTVTKSDVGLGNADNTADVDKPVSTLQAAADAAAIATAKAYADTLVVGLLDDRGNYNASGNTFPASGGSGSAGAILKGDLWTISVAGTLGGHPVTAGDLVRALVDTPGQTDANWAIQENNFGYVAENSANKDASGGYAGLTLFKINFRNALNTFTSFLTNSNTAARTYTFQDRDGTIADNTDLSGKQATLVSGTNIKTVNSTSLLGSGDVAIPSPSIGGGITGATAGSILFAATGPVFAQNNTALFWDDANTQLKLTAGAATKTPLYVKLAASQSADALQVYDSAGTTKQFSVDKQGNIRVVSSAYGLIFRMQDANGVQLNFDCDNGIFQLGNTTAFKYINPGNSTSDLGWARASAGLFKITDGGSGLGKIAIAGGTPASASATGAQGQVLWDTSYIYVCVATNTWLRAGIATW